jgi:hypothetical protein
VIRTDQTMTLRWGTDEVADSFVEFGERRDFLDKLAGKSEDVFDHYITLTGLSPGGTYFYRVGSVDRENNPPATSDVFQFTTETVGDTEAPDVPTNLKAAAGSEAVWLTWQANAESDLAGYNVYRQSSSSGSFQMVASLLERPEFTDKGRTNGVNYNYSVTALDNALPQNESERSLRVGVRPSITSGPGEPTALSVRASPREATLTIVNAAPVSLDESLTYTFQVSSDFSFGDVVASAARVPEGTSQTSWTFNRDLERDKVYWWRARASDELFSGAWMKPSRFEVIGWVGDFNGDGVVDFDDFFSFADHFSQSEQSLGWDPVFDLTRDGRVDFDDFFSFADHFGDGTRVAKQSAAWSLLSSADVKPELKLVRIDKEEAVIALDIFSMRKLRGFGAVFRHAPGVDIKDTSPDLWQPGFGNATLLRGVLSQTSTQTAIGSYVVKGQLPEEAETRVLEVTLALSSDFVGSEVSLEELWAIDAQGTLFRLSSNARVMLRPLDFQLAAPYPNPFNSVVVIDYALPRKTSVQLAVYNVTGQKIQTLVSEVQEPGFHRVKWHGVDANGRRVGSGLYLLNIRTNGFRATQKAILLK